MYDTLLIFFIYAFLGWCVEVSYAALRTGQFVNRGFLNGPVCPIYGFGMIIVLKCLGSLQENLILLCLSAIVLTSILEFLAGFALEKLFHQRWWDYSEEPFNLGGYICLRFSIAWGLACLFVVKLVHPTVYLMVNALPLFWQKVIVSLSVILMMVDALATVTAIAQFNRRLRQIDEIAMKIREVSDELGENLADKIIDAAERGADIKEDFIIRRAELQELSIQRKNELWNELTEKKTKLQRILDTEPFGQSRLLKAFPKMRSIDHGTALEHLKHRIEYRKKRGNKNE